MSAVRALASRRKWLRMPWRRCASSSRNDQLEAPDVTAGASSERALHPAHERLRPPAKPRLGFPGEVVPEEPHRLDALLASQKAQRAETTERLVAEQVLALAGEAVLGEQPARREPGQRPAGEHRRAAPHQGTSWRALSACASVT